MAYSVEKETFFHINSNANLSQYDLMRTGSVVEIGQGFNPFFGIYETQARTEMVNNKQAGKVEEVPALRFLRLVRDGGITTSSLPSVAFGTANHFMLLSRELVWESIRQSEFPDEPSRQRCIWLVRTADEARQWVTTLKFRPHTYSLVRLRATGKALDADGKHIPDESEPLTLWREKARRYWRGEMSADPTLEILFEGAIEVEEILRA